ncbi:carbamoyl-phosphate synthase small chain, chloroplastic-like isoform X4 [Macadamia integrifolia]|uniref:carbamoyl-phosphate synthase small chain, chloroplastic-like isoform X4 n=1 Tax=Macadamia integrifolia TaxID=60698 RepID=UPI001C528C03|nr:carbamoyl-phosphate synthase small chain, chloroplastic-like isoform X4 [Macadamia integrifolia]
MEGQVVWCYGNPSRRSGVQHIFDRGKHILLGCEVDLIAPYLSFSALQWVLGVESLNSVVASCYSSFLPWYQEILTDPSYAGQFVLMTNPQIGNTGVNLDDEESGQCFLGGLVIRSLSISTSNWRCRQTLGDYLEERNIMGIYDVDTRAVTRRLREYGSLVGVLTTEDSKTDEELLQMSHTWDIVGVDLISGVSCNAPYEWLKKTDPEWEFITNGRAGENLHVVAYDFGIKHNILRRLASQGCKITVVPSTWPASETLKLCPDGVLFSNGPGDPSAVPYAVETNHNYAVDHASLPEGVEVTHVNLNDGSCAGLAFPALKVMTLQYHPEASPGPHDSDPAFSEFIELMRKEK